MEKTTEGALVGKFYHTYRDGVIEHQGEILSLAAPGLYLVQLFEWLMGTVTDQRLVPVAEMMCWKFYDCREDWHLAYEKHRQRERSA